MSTKKPNEIAEALVRGMAHYVAEESMAEAVLQLIDDGEIEPYIGFYKHCRECGIRLNTRHRYLRDIVKFTMEKPKKRFRDD